MSDTAPGKSNSMESPVKNTQAPKGDRELPTKIYPSSSKLATKDGGKPGASMDSPAKPYGEK